MNTEKISVSISKVLAHFVEEYQNNHECKSKSEVIQEALKLLRQKELENCYRQANNEIDSSFDSTIDDGLENETW